MTITLKKAQITGVAVLALGAATFASAPPTAAQHGGGGGGFGGHGGFGGGHGGAFGGHGGFGGGHLGYYGYPGYYASDCYLVRRRVVGRHGRVFIRRVQVCD